MTINQLKYVVEINKCGSISKAAQKLYVSQPHLSKQLHELERELKISIFKRSKTGIELTAEGNDFLVRALRILNEVSDIKEIYSDDYKAENCIRLSSVIIPHGIVTCIGMLNEHNNEKIKFVYNEKSPTEVTADIQIGEAELGIILAEKRNINTVKRILENKNIVFDSICSTSVCIVANKNHPLIKQGEPVKIEEIYDYGIVLPSLLKGYLLDSQNPEIITDILEEDKIRNLVYVNSRSALNNILVSTDYISFGTEGMPDNDGKYGVWSIPIDNELINSNKVDVLLIYQKNRKLSPLAKEFRNLLIKYWSV